MSKARKVAIMAGVGLLACTGAAVADDRANKGGGKAKDTQLEAGVEADIQKDRRLVDRVDAQVRQGRVTLTGTVETDADKVRVEQLARTRGARAIDNQVSVTAPGPASEAAAQQAGANPLDDAGQVRPLSDPRRRDPLVGAMPRETVTRELRMRTLGMDDPKLQQPDAGTQAQPPRPAAAPQQPEASPPIQTRQPQRQR